MPLRKKSLKIKVKSRQPCPSNKERNPNTQRCILKCKDGFERNSEFKCRKSCVLPKIRFPGTGRCRNPPKSRKRKIKQKTRSNPVRISRKKKSPPQMRECSVCQEPTNKRTFCTHGSRHPLCEDCYYGLIGFHRTYNRPTTCPVCRDTMTRPPAL